MANTDFEIVTVEERIRLLDLRPVGGKSRLHVLRCKKRVPTKPPEPDIQITENGYLLCQVGGRLFSCTLTERERKLVSAILEAKERILENAFAVFQLDIWKNRDKSVWNGIVGTLNRKMKREGMPLRLVQEGWHLQICIRR